MRDYKQRPDFYDHDRPAFKGELKAFLIALAMTVVFTGAFGALCWGLAS